jgi:hypothetical protein
MMKFIGSDSLSLVYRRFVAAPSISEFHAFACVLNL